jgi:pimeloyl-ACP methyl ester carboxylesterase
MRVRSALAALAALLAVLAAAPAAPAAMTYAPCEPTGFECGALAVPLDRSGAVPGTVVLHAKRLVASGGPARSAVVALAGGPGQAALPVTTEFASLLRPALTDRDLLVFDQRGTGTSNRLSCSAFDDPTGSILALAARCASQLGPARGSFRSADTVEDIETLRVESGYDRIVLFGVSYGTKVALDYAARYPSRVEALVLDSVVPPEGSDVLNRSTFAAVDRVLAELCSHRACRGITTGVRRDLAALVAKVRRKPLHGRINDSRGHRLDVSLTASGLLEVLLAGDLNPTLRAELPGSMRSALRGDARPVLRLRARAAGLSGILQQGPLDAADSDALFAATRCEESSFPWDRAAGADVRASEAVSAARALNASFRPFDYRVALGSEAIPLCLAWPDASPAPGAPGPLPAVPTLILGGLGDLRTPIEDDRAVAARIPGAQVVAVPYTGHSVLGSDLSGCASDALAAFFAGQPAGSCGSGEQVFTPTQVAPTRLARLPGRTRALRTLAAVRATITDIRRQFIGDAIAAGRSIPAGSRAGGLRSGTALWTTTGIRLRSVEYVPGVLVSGLRPHGGAAATYTVRGTAAAHGTVTLHADGSATGRLGGRRIVAADARAARSGTGGMETGWPQRPPAHPRLLHASR